MTDRALRALERRWLESKSPELELRLLTRLHGAGELELSQLRLAGLLGHGPSQACLRDLGHAVPLHLYPGLETLTQPVSACDEPRQIAALLVEFALGRRSLPPPLEPREEPHFAQELRPYQPGLVFEAPRAAHEGLAEFWIHAELSLREGADARDVDGLAELLRHEGRWRPLGDDDEALGALCARIAPAAEEIRYAWDALAAGCIVMQDSERRLAWCWSPRDIWGTPQSKIYLLTETGFIRLALAAADQALTDETPDLEPVTALRLRALALREHCEHERARADLQRATALAPQDASLLGLLARTLNSLERYAEAEEVLDRALALDDPYKAEAYRDRANARLALGNPAGALEDCDAALAQRPRYRTAHFARGRARRALGDLQGALADLDAALELDEDYSQALSERAQVLVELKRYEEAQEDFARYEALNPNCPTGPGVRAWLHHQQGELEAALGAYSESIVLAPGDPDYYERRSAMHRALEDYEGARVDAASALALNSSRPTAHSAYGWALYGLGDHQGALSSFVEAGRLEPSSGVHDYNQALALVLQEQLQAAWEATIRAQGKGMSCRDCLDLKGRIAVDRRDVAEALKAWSEVVALDDAGSADEVGAGERSTALGYLAQSLAWAESWDRSAAACERAKELTPDSDWPWRCLAILHQCRGDLTSAERALSSAQALSPDPDTLAARGRVRSLGDLPGAREDLEQAALQGHVYARIWRLAFAGEDFGTPELDDAWRTSLIQLLRGELELEAAIASADASEPSWVRSDRLSEANCYAGLRAERRGDLTEARRLYDATLAIGDFFTVEIDIARVRRAALT